jgi:hypothetical protein
MILVVLLLLVFLLEEPELLAVASGFVVVSENLNKYL